MNPYTYNQKIYDKQCVAKLKTQKSATKKPRALLLAKILTDFLF